MVWHLAIDFGASSGRHILGGIENGKLVTQEIYRFDNNYINKNGTLCWDTEKLFSEIINGLKKCAELQKIPQTVAIDTWGVDFALLDGEDKLCGDTVSYRDGRTEGLQDEVHSIIDEQTLFERTGIQSHPFNTLYQLYALKKQQPEVLEKAETLLFLPDYFAYLLTGKKFCEQTIASTSEIINLKTGTWDGEVLDTLGIKKSILLPVSPSCTMAGPVKKEIADEIGFTPEVILAAAHDTGSAVVSIISPDKNKMYISSGTWSLMGIESDVPFTASKCREDGFSNEGGCFGNFRVLKNIMGLWLIQSVRHEFGDKYSFDELCEMAECAEDAGGFIDVCDDRFLAPENMTKEIQNACREQGLCVPETPGELARIIYHSLAKTYAESAAQIEKMTGCQYNSINVIGGGSNADYLNRLTFEYSGKKVLAGPGEATAIGNLSAQLIACGEVTGAEEARCLIRDSFNIKYYER